MRSGLDGQAGLLEPQAQVVGIRLGLEGVLDGHQAAPNEPQKGGLERLHPVELALLDDLIDLRGQGGWSTSIGSSIVSMWTALLLLMWSIMQASVVVFPLPVGPVTRTRPRGAEASSRTTGGSPSSSNEGLPTRTLRMTMLIDPRCR